MLAPMALTCPGSVADALAQVGRTEDIAFSPDGRRLALAGFTANAVLVVDLDVPADGSGVALTGSVTLTCDGFRAPHGIAFADDRTVFVANREGGVVAVPVPPSGTEGTVDVCPSLDLGRLGTIAFDEPGSLTVVDTGLGLFEVLVCHNGAAEVSRHLVDWTAERSLVDEERLLHSGLDIPDSVALSADARWLAVSNHVTHEVLVFRNDPTLGPHSAPVGRLEGPRYPHGLSFAGDDTYLLVADAGRPYVHVFHSTTGWDGVRRSDRAVQVKDDATFTRGHYNDREGGPKGLDVHHDLRLVAITSEFQPLALYPLDEIVGTTASPASSRSDPSTSGAAAGRATVLRTLARLAEAERILRLVLQGRPRIPSEDVGP